MRSIPLGSFLLLWLSSLAVTGAAPSELDTKRGDRMIADYFESETAKLSEACLADVETLEDWTNQRKKMRRQLLEMLGLDPFPPRTDLRPVTTSKTEHEEFVVENVHFQSRPGLYVTGNLYVPKERKGRIPAVLYVCGHGGVKKDGISYGNKVHYQHHGAWFARNGYVCLAIDTVQLGEIEGIHHGTYRYDMWWWLNRGYTPAGVEAWNCVRALDYLQSREEVDPQRLGVTGRSGGGAYSWWIAAIDERIQAAVPVAGITDLENHVVDGCVEGHCDCMYLLNTYRWDYALVAALVAPRPLLISNTDSDRIFPLDGVVRTFEKVRRIYRLYDAEDKIGLNITSGPHKDTQELRIHAFRWLNHHLKQDDALIEKPAVGFFEPKQLRVFQDLPEDQKNTEIHESFVGAAAKPSVPGGKTEWGQWRDLWRSDLRRLAFAGWPQEPGSLGIQPAIHATSQDVQLSAFDFTSQGSIRLRLYLLQTTDPQPVERTVLHVLDDESWWDTLAALRPAFEEDLGEEVLPDADTEAWNRLRSQLRSTKQALAYVAPRGIGPTAWDQSERKQIQHRRRFYLLGQTLDGMRIWDVRRAIETLHGLDQPVAKVPVVLAGRKSMAGVALYASLYEPNVKGLLLTELPSSHRQGPFLLNVRRILDTPQTLAMAAEHCRIQLNTSREDEWKYPRQVIEALGWKSDQLEIRQLGASAPQ